MEGSVYLTVFDVIISIFVNVYNTGVYLFSILNSKLSVLIDDTGVSGVIENWFIPDFMLDLTLIELLFGVGLLSMLVFALIRFFSSASPL